VRLARPERATAFDGPNISKQGTTHCTHHLVPDVEEDPSRLCPPFVPRQSRCCPTSCLVTGRKEVSQTK